MLISVLIPAYNAAATVESAVMSVLRQTFTDFEIVVVDDGSTDDTATVVSRLSVQDSRVRLIKAEHVGLISALNVGLDACRGDLLARMDADDYCHPERLRFQSELMLADPAISVCSSLVRSFPQSAVPIGFRYYEKWLNSILNHDEIARDMFVESPVAHPSVLLRTTELRELGGYEEHGWPEDYDLWLRYFEAGKRFAKVPRTLLFWRAQQSRLTITDSRYSLENFMRAKAHYLAKMLRGRHNEIILWGAGMTGRRLAKHLVREGLAIRCVVDIDPSKIGRTVRGIPIISPDELPHHPDAFVITAVGSTETREIIRGRLAAMGRVETRDYVCAS
jgi:glycosyltransferase involved in cell wall biosynthesis